MSDAGTGAPVDSAHAPGPAPADAVAAAPIDCGTVDQSSTLNPPQAKPAYKCFVDAFTAGNEAVVKFIGVSDEGAKGFTTYRSVPAASGGGMEIELTIDDRQDGFSANPGIHVQRCTKIRTEPTTSGGVVLYPEGCH